MRSGIYEHQCSSSIKIKGEGYLFRINLEIARLRFLMNTAAGIETTKAKRIHGNDTRIPGNDKIFSTAKV
jgi:hypothetical protein